MAPGLHTELPSGFYPGHLFSHSVPILTDCDLTFTKYSILLNACIAMRSVDY